MPDPKFNHNKRKGAAKMMLAKDSFTLFMWLILTPCAYATGVNLPPPGYASSTEFCASVSNSANASISNTGTAFSTSASGVSLQGVTAPNHVAGGANPSMDLKGSAYSAGQAVTSGAGTANYSGAANGNINSVASKNMRGIGYTVQHGKIHVDSGVSGVAKNGATVNGTVESMAALNAVSTLSLPKIGITDVKGALVQGSNNGGVISGNANANFQGVAGR